MQSLHPAFTSPRYQEAILASGPLRYYRCNETSGTLLRDLCRTADMTISGTPTKRGANGAPGVADSAGFQTTSGSGGFASAAAAALPTTAYTLAAWTFGGSVSDRGIFGQWQANVGALIYRSSATKLAFIHRGTNLIASNTNDGNWHFAVGTWDGTNVRLYVDGVLRGGPSANSTAAGSTGSWTIGTYTVTSNNALRITTGITSECVLWPRALSVAEIDYFYALGSGR